MSEELKKLQKALEAGYPMPSDGSLVGGAPLVIEDLDVSGLGLYREKDLSVADDDYIPAETVIGRWGIGYWMRKSDQGTKWHIYEDKELKLLKNLVKK